MNLLPRSTGRLLPLLLLAAVLASSLTTASAFGRRSKPWSSKASEAARHPTASVSSSTSPKHRGIFRRERVSRSSATEVPPQSAQPPRVRATTAKPAAEPVTKTRRGLLARLFKPEPRERQPEANVAVARRTKVQPSPAPNPVQAPPRYNQALIGQAKSRGSSVVINIARQRAYVYVGGEVAIDTPVSTARSGKYTPRGSFGIGEKVRQGKISTIYNVGMPYWMRLGSSPYGMHAGYLPGYPASAGCIRMPYEAAQKVYDTVGAGTRVKIVSG